MCCFDCETKNQMCVKGKQSGGTLRSRELGEGGRKGREGLRSGRGRCVGFGLSSIGLLG